MYFLFLQIRKTNVALQNMGFPTIDRSQIYESQLVRMMMFIVLIFVLTNMFDCLFWFCMHYNLVSNLIIIYLDTISDFLQTFNSSINVLIYARYNGKFQRIFNQTFGFFSKKKTLRNGNVFSLSPITISVQVTPSK